MTLITDLVKQPCIVETDRDAWEQVLINLIDNVIKYAANGKELQVALRQADGRLTVAIMDRGPGISAAHRERAPGEPGARTTRCDRDAALAGHAHHRGDQVPVLRAVPVGRLELDIQAGGTARAARCTPGETWSEPAGY